jgi:uncharacterized protein (TIGR02284 family)
MMNQKELNEALSDLVQAAIDAVFSYQQAIPKVEDEIMRTRLEAFCKSHEENIEELAQAITRLGGKPPEFTRGFKAYIFEGVSVLRSLSGTKGALKALQAVEERTNRFYGQAVSWEVPEDPRDLLRKQFSDVKVHLEYINSNLKALS